MRRMILCIALLALCIGHVAALAQGQPERRRMRMPQDVRVESTSDRSELKMKDFGGRPVVEVMIKGQGPFDFFFDTGAGGTALTAELAAELDLDSTGVMRVGDPVHPEGIETTIVATEAMQLGDFTAHGVKSPALPAKRLPKGEGAPRGVLSMNSFPGVMVTFDWAGDRIILEKGALPEADGKTVLDYKAPMGIPELPIQIGDQTIAVHLDTGAPKTILLPMKYAEKLNLDGELKEVGKARLVGGEMILMGAKLEDEIHIGEHAIEGPMISFNEKMPHGNMGSAILSKFVLTLDPANKRLRITKPTGVAGS